MTDDPLTVLVVGATGSIGRLVVAEALRRRHRVRALVRDAAKAERVLPASTELVVGDLTRPGTLGAAAEGSDAIVFTRGSGTREAEVRDIDYAGVVNVLAAAAGRPVRIAGPWSSSRPTVPNRTT